MQFEGLGVKVWGPRGLVFRVPKIWVLFAFFERYVRGGVLM